MGVFRFKQFSVQNERSSMKVNTDGVLLGAAMTLRPSDRLLLDIGTGTGVIALMAAQRLAEVAENFNITGIDIDYDSALEAKENFLSSPWSDHLVARHISLSDFEKECNDPQRASVFPCAAETECTKKWYNPAQGFDLIFSNPPYFESSLKSPNERRCAARHAETLSYREIIAFASRHLTPTGHLTGNPDCNEGQHPTVLPRETECDAGRLSMILSYETEREAVRYAASFNLRLFRRLRVRTTPSHPFSRVILEFVLDSPETISNEHTNIEKPAITDDEFTIQNSAGYTDSYRSLVKNFLLI